MRQIIFLIICLALGIHANAEKGSTPPCPKQHVRHSWKLAFLHHPFAVKLTVFVTMIILFALALYVLTIVYFKICVLKDPEDPEDHKDPDAKTQHIKMNSVFPLFKILRGILSVFPRQKKIRQPDLEKGTEKEDDEDHKYHDKVEYHTETPSSTDKVNDIMKAKEEKEVKGSEEIEQEPGQNDVTMKTENRPNRTEKETTGKKIYKNQQKPGKEVTAKIRKEKSSRKVPKTNKQKRKNKSKMIMLIKMIRKKFKKVPKDKKTPKETNQYKPDKKK